MEEKSLELKLLVACTDGIAYFEDSSGERYFLPERGDIRPLVDGRDNHPMMYQFSKENPLAEEGRGFPNLEEARDYVRAINSFDKIVDLTNRVFSVDLNQDFRDRSRDLILRYQEILRKEETLKLLDSIPMFEKVRQYLFMSPEEIYTDLMEKN